MESIVFNCGKLCFPSHITLKLLRYARWMAYDKLHSIYKISLWYMDWLCITMFDHAPILILLQLRVQYDYALLDKKRLLIINNNYLKNAMFNSLILGAIPMLYARMKHIRCRWRFANKSTTCYRLLRKVHYYSI